MLSLSNGGMSASHAGKYFSQEDYYLKGEEPSRWLGKSAATFRLQGRVKEAAFRNLASGKSPDGWRQLVTPKITKGEDGAQVENHRAGNDLTFSAPKSVSIGYAAGNRELKEIWDQAVVNTMKHVEDHYSHYRTPDGVESAGNIIAAKFDHVTSRALDPEVHSHVFLLNMVQTPEGWQANEPKNIYQDKIALGMLAREEAINLYRKAGCPVYFTDREQLLFELEGVRREEIEAFSKRRSAILDKVSQWKEEKRFPGVDDTILKQMAALETRDPKRQVTKEDVRRAWDKTFADVGTTAQEVRARIQAARQLEEAKQQAEPAGCHSPAEHPPSPALMEEPIPRSPPFPSHFTAEEVSDVVPELSDQQREPRLVTAPGSAIPLEELMRERRRENLYFDTPPRFSNDELRDYARDGNPTAQPELDRRYINEAFVDFEEWSTPSADQNLDETLASLEGLKETITRHEKFNPSAKRMGFLRQVEERISELPSHVIGQKSSEQQPELFPQHSARHVVKQAANILTEKEVVFDRARLLKTAAQICGGNHSIEELEAATGKKETGLHFLGRETCGWQAGKEFYTTEEMLKLEARNRDTLGRLRTFASVTSRPEVEAYLKGLAGESESALTSEEVRHQYAFRAGVASAVASGRVNLSAGQREHLLNELAGDKGFAVTQGDPGTGKTFASGIIERFNAEVLEPTGRMHHTINVAYTGKAALEMENANGKRACTIDAFLNRYRGSTDVSAFLETSVEPPETAQQVVIKVDEASFVGGRQASQILEVAQDLGGRGYQVKLSLVGDSKQLQSLQASPFFNHALEHARDGVGDYAVMKEITRQKDSGLLEVAKLLNRERGDQLLGTNAADALKMLQQQGRVVEIPERLELVKAAVTCYLSESSKPSPSGGKQSVLLVTPLNADRHELNRDIRQARILRGKLEKGETVEVLVPVEHGVTASSFHPGTTVIFGGDKAKNLEGVRANGRGEVRAIDTLSNKVKVDFPDGRSQIFEASDLAQHSSLYRREPRDFSKGDLIVFGKNTRDRSIVAADGAGKTVGVRNGERGEITEIRTAGKETIARIKMLSDGRNIDLQLTRFGPQHIDHGYAVTVHKGQGETVDSVISFNYVKPMSSNDRNRLQSITGMQISDEEYNRWNSSLSDMEKSYQAQTRIGGHAGRISFVMIADSQNPREQKGIAITFSNGRDIVEDESVRSQMREAGMYWSPTVGAWVTAVTNDSAIHLIPRHPLKDRQYVEHLKTFAKSQIPPHPEERNYTAAIDTTADMVKYGRASYNAFNVAMTRAKHEASLFTNSVSGLRKSIQQVDQKTTTISNPGIDRSPTPSVPHQTPPLTKTKELQKELKLPKR